MTTLNLPDLEQRPQPRRDRFGRYLIVPANGGQPRSYTRATTWAKALDDMEGLINWSMRMTAKGLVVRKDLYAQVAACRADDDKALKALVEDAKEAGGGSEGRNIGSALHAFTEQVDLGEKVTVPDQWRADVDAYQQALADAGLTVLTEYVEQVVVLEELGVAGTFDRIYRTGDGTLVIGDVKTGQSLDFSRLSIAVQLALYANADTIYDLGSETHTPMVHVDKQTALVVHVPSGQGKASVEEFDIAKGWERVQLAGQVREARAEGRRKNVLCRPYKPGRWPGIVPAPAEEPAATEPMHISVPLRQWVLTRLRKLDEPKLAAAKQTMRELWPDNIPKFITGHAHTDAELRRLAECLDAVERTYEIGFGPSDPTVERTPPIHPIIQPDEPKPERPGPIDEGPEISQEDVDAVIAVLNRLPAEQKAALESWAKEAHQAGRSFSIKFAHSTRRRAIYQALIALAPLVDDDLERVRATVATVISDAAMPTVPLGSAIGALTIAEADLLRNMAHAVRNDEPALQYGLDGAVRWAFPTIDNTDNQEG